MGSLRKQFAARLAAVLALIWLGAGCAVGQAALPPVHEPPAPAAQSGQPTQPPPGADSTPSATGAAAPALRPTVTASPTPLAGTLPLRAPVDGGWVDASYRFGSTNDGRREAHTGVEFPARHGTPVLAAGDAVVVAAGTDEDTPYYLDRTRFYGSLVVLEHRVAGLDQPVYTLYGHLSAVSVRVGERVTAGQEIGQVGDTGWATGPHLHLEVRLGENTASAAQNPELWLRGDGETGALAVRLIGPTSQVNVQALDAEGEPAGRAVYLDPYDPALPGERAPWAEQAGLGNLAPGKYRVAYIVRGALVEQVAQVRAGAVAVVGEGPSRP